MISPAVSPNASFVERLLIKAPVSLEHRTETQIQEVSAWAEV
jgi:hypothetical protein